MVLRKKTQVVGVCISCGDDVEETAWSKHISPPPIYDTDLHDVGVYYRCKNPDCEWHERTEDETQFLLRNEND